MRHPALSTQEFWAGAIFAALGLGALFVARSYDMGSTMRMGPGYFPMLLGAVLLLLGAASCAKAWLRGDGTPLEAMPWRSALLVTASALSFALLLERAGLALTVLASTVIAALAGRHFRAGEALAIALLLAAFTSVLFVYALGLPVTIGPAE